MYIPKFSAITDNPNPRTSDSELAFSIKDNVDSIGVNPTFTISLNMDFHVPCLQCMVRMSSMLH